jgi:hypothetical protein
MFWRLHEAVCDNSNICQSDTRNENRILVGTVLGKHSGWSGEIRRAGQLVSVELAHNEIIEGNEPRDFIKVTNFKIGCVSRKEILKVVSLFLGGGHFPNYFI